MFHFKLLELEAELIAKEDAARGMTEMTPECIQAHYTFGVFETTVAIG